MKWLVAYVLRVGANILMGAVLSSNVAGANAASPQDVFVRIRAVGDMQLGNSPTNMVPSFNYFHKVMPELRDADILFGNHESTMCDENTRSHKCRGNAMCFGFRSPTRVSQYFKEAGFDVLNLANNHIFDYGDSCASTSKKTITDAGILAIGLKDSKSSPISQITGSLEFRGKKIAFVGIHYSDAWGRVISINDTAQIKPLIESVRKSYDLVIVSVHAGAEGPAYTRVPMGQETHKGERRGNMREFSRVVIDAGADLVIGHGPHVLRGLETYKNKLIIHSLGNFATYTLFSFDNPMQLGAIVEAGLSINGDLVQGRIISTHQYYDVAPGGGRGQVQLDFDKQKRAIHEIKRLSELDFTSYPHIEDDGRFYLNSDLAVSKK